MVLTSARACLLLTISVTLIAFTEGAQPPAEVKTEKPDLKLQKIELGYTAFPDLKPPMKTTQGVEHADFDKLREQVIKKLALRVPDDATPLRKVQLHQVNEGAGYLKKMFEVIQIGNWRPSDLDGVLNVASEVFRMAAETEATPAARVSWYEDRIAVLKAYEEVVTVLVQPAYGLALLTDLHLARFRRLQSEAELLKLKAEIETAGKK